MNVGERVLITDYYKGLLVVDVADRTNPRHISISEIVSSPRDMALSGNYAYVATSDSFKVKVTRRFNINI